MEKNTVKFIIGIFWFGKKKRKKQALGLQDQKEFKMEKKDPIVNLIIGMFYVFCFLGACMILEQHPELFWGVDPDWDKGTEFDDTAPSKKERKQRILDYSVLETPTIPEIEEDITYTEVKGDRIYLIQQRESYYFVYIAKKDLNMGVWQEVGKFDSYLDANIFMYEIQAEDGYY